MGGVPVCGCVGGGSYLDCGPPAGWKVSPYAAGPLLPRWSCLSSGCCCHGQTLPLKYTQTHVRTRAPEGGHTLIKVTKTILAMLYTTITCDSDGHITNTDCSNLLETSRKKKNNLQFQITSQRNLSMVPPSDLKYNCTSRLI